MANMQAEAREALHHFLAVTGESAELLRVVFSRHPEWCLNGRSVAAALRALSANVLALAESLDACDLRGILDDVKQMKES